MTDFTRLVCTPPPAHWTDDGIYRAAYLALFDAEDRTVLRRAGKVLALQAYRGDTASGPEIVAGLWAALEDARMLATFLRAIAESTEGTRPDRALHLADKAELWSCEVAAIVRAIRRALNGFEEPEPDPVARLIRAARAILRDHRERRGLLWGSSSLVDALEDALVALEGEKATDP